MGIFRKTQPRRRRWIRRVLAIGALALGLAALLGGIYLYRLTQEVDRLWAARSWHLPSIVYSDSRLLYPGQVFAPQHLQAKLDRLGYRETEAAPSLGGQYRWRATSAGKVLDLHLNDLNTPWKQRAGFVVQISWDGAQILKLTVPARNQTLPLVELDPEELARFFGPERQQRDLVTLGEVPEHVRQAVLAAEDGRFYSHRGVDPAGILRALGTNLKRGAVVQGGSTITQQLMKNFFLTPERTLGRKVKEILMALWVDHRHSKDAILEMYLNEIYLGQRGSVAIHGMGEGARLYFGCRVRDLSLAQAATLAGLIRGPNHYAPYRHPARARTRRNHVLEAMLHRGWISAVETQKAQDAPLTLAGYAMAYRRAPYFLDYVSEQLQQHYSREDLNRLGLNIYTTLDLEIQLAAEEALAAGLTRLEAGHPGYQRHQSQGPLQGALLVVQPQTGVVLAMVGGRDYTESQFNRITQARRQPGSTFKPLIYAMAMPPLTPATLLSNQVRTYTLDGRAWTPKNYRADGPATVSLREALAHSYNLATVDLAMRIGLPRVVEAGRKFGLTTSLKPYPAVALGAFETIPLELARAYCVFAAKGVAPRILPFKSVATSEGQVLQRRHVILEQVLTPEQAYLMTSLLRSVVTQGTARGLYAQGITFPVAGKTGTTNDFRDAWFVGYTPDILALVWVGFDHGASLEASGGQAAMPIWAELIKSLPQYHSESWFSQPAGVIPREICTASGALARPGRCPETRQELFLADTEPTQLCPLHQFQNPFRQLTKEVHNFIKSIAP